MNNWAQENRKTKFPVRLNDILFKYCKLLLNYFCPSCAILARHHLCFCDARNVKVLCRSDQSLYVCHHFSFLVCRKIYWTPTFVTLLSSNLVFYKDQKAAQVRILRNTLTLVSLELRLVSSLVIKHASICQDVNALVIALTNRNSSKQFDQPIRIPTNYL